jgi:processive 1,2-diacylglycerol beta-glucosyltransferase
MRTLVVDGNFATSCGYHRLMLPFMDSDITPKVPVFVFNRLPLAGMQEITRRRALGYRLVLDLDDYWHLPTEHYLYDAHTRYGMPAALETAIKQADAVMVTNDELAARVTPLNPEVAVVPNALPFGDGQFVLGSRQGHARFIYAAGPSHLPDLRVAATALNQSDVTLAGFNDNEKQWQKMRALVPQVQITKQVNVTKYMRVYEGHQVAVAPLVDNTFNRCKSNLKLLEAGAKGMPLIASPVAPYNHPRDRDFVIHASTEAEWVAAMTRCRRDPQMVEERGQALHEHVKTHYSLAAANEIRRQVLESFS